MPDWSVVENASECDIATLSEGVFSFGRALAVGGEARPIACFLREEDGILAGASGRTEYERLFVSLLWVVDRLRCRGIGAEVLARLEEAATERGCRDALIETMNDRTAALIAEHTHVYPQPRPRKRRRRGRRWRRAIGRCRSTSRTTRPTCGRWKRSSRCAATCGSSLRATRKPASSWHVPTRQP